MQALRERSTFESIELGLVAGGTLLRRADGGRSALRSKSSSIEASLGELLVPRIERPGQFQVALLGLAASAAVRRLGPARSGWAFAAALTRGLMLATAPLPTR